MCGWLSPVTLMAVAGLASNVALTVELFMVGFTGLAALSIIPILVLAFFLIYFVNSCKIIQDAHVAISFLESIQDESKRKT